MKKLDVKLGQKFNMLTVLDELPVRNKSRMFKCRCECGSIKSYRIAHLVRFRMVSCGCHKKKLHTKHGMWRSREYSTWENMIQRCYNPKSHNYCYYGGKGIKVCDSWLKSFDSFYKDMGHRPLNTTLDRKDSDKDYCKENCQWKTPLEQLGNLSRYGTLVKINGVLKTVEEWIFDLKLNRNIFKSRVSRGLGYKTSLLGAADIIVLDSDSKQQSIHHLDSFINLTKFNKDKILGLADTDHEEPYHGYLIRYLIGFKGWPKQYNDL